MSSEPKLIILNIILVVLTFVFPRARVLTLPFVFIAVLTALFWSARLSADAQAKKEKDSEHGHA